LQLIQKIIPQHTLGTGTNRGVKWGDGHPGQQKFSITAPHKNKFNRWLLFLLSSWFLLKAPNVLTCPKLPKNLAMLHSAGTSKRPQNSLYTWW